jgi:hypothetical protein
MGNAGGILANEFSASRVKVLHANISRCGISNVALTHFDGRVLAALARTFDAILLDAPAPAKGWYVKTRCAEKLVAGEQPRDRRHPARAYRQRLPCPAPWRDAGVFHLHPESRRKRIGH